MEASVECTHCGVVMTSWSVPGSPIRYYQCPFCARTHSSLYGEVFRRRAGARVVKAPQRASRPCEIPMATPEDVRWALIKTSAARWFARLEADERRLASTAARRSLHSVPTIDEPPEIDPADVVEIAAAGRKRSLHCGRSECETSSS